MRTDDHDECVTDIENNLREEHSTARLERALRTTAHIRQSHVTIQSGTSVQVLSN